jgi:hypothetical protein
LNNVIPACRVGATLSGDSHRESFLKDVDIDIYVIKKDFGQAEMTVNNIKFLKYLGKLLADISVNALL